MKKALASPWALLIIAAACTGAVYGRVLGLPYLFDDTIHLRWIDGRPWWSVWLDVAEMQHYRPLVMSLWALAQRWFPHDPLPLQILILLIHTVNATLTGLLARRLSDRRLAGPVAVVLMATFPFDYQALLSAGSLSKPVSALLILVAVLLYWRGRTRGSRAALVGACLAAMLAPFAYESAVAAGGFLVLTEFALWRSGRVERPCLWSLAAIGLSVPFFIAWRLVPSDSSGCGFPGWEAVWQSSIYFQQALTWPVALLAKPLMRWTGLSDLYATALVTYAILLLLAVWYVRQRRGWLLLVAVGWLIGSIAVQWMMLTFRYIIDGPRMLYLSGAAFALLWADLLTTWVTRRWQRILSASAIVAILAWGGCFARQRVELADDVSAPLTAAVELASASPEGLTAFVNVPRWYGFAEGETGFALGHEGYTVLPTYYNIGLSDFAWAQTGTRYEMRVLAHSSIRGPWRVNLGYDDMDNDNDLVEVLRGADAAYALDYDLAQLFWVSLGGAANSDGQTALACYEGGPCLLDLQITPEQEGYQIDLVWQVETPPTEPLTVFLHLYRPDGTLATQDDGEPFAGLLPFAQWEPGEAHRDTHHLAGQMADEAGWTVGVGLYHPDTGERLPALDAEGQRLPNDTYRQALQP